MYNGRCIFSFTATIRMMENLFLGLLPALSALLLLLPIVATGHLRHRRHHHLKHHHLEAGVLMPLCKYSAPVKEPGQG